MDMNLGQLQHILLVIALVRNTEHSGRGLLKTI